MSKYSCKIKLSVPKLPAMSIPSLQPIPKKSRGIDKDINSYSKEELIDAAIDKYILEGKTLDLIDKITTLFKK